MTPDLVILGNLLVDDMVFSDGLTRMAEPGGASLLSFAAGVASVRGDDYPEQALDALTARGRTTTRLEVWRKEVPSSDDRCR